MPVLYWFKNDLRLHDNEALSQAVATGEPLLCCYCFDNKQYKLSDLGFYKTNQIRFQFLLDCLSDLRNQLQNLGGDLIVLTGDPTKEISKLVEKYAVDTIFTEEEHAEEELENLRAVEASLPKPCHLQTYWGRTLYHRDDIPFSIPEIPLVSKTYRIKTTKETEVRPCISTVIEINFLAIDTYTDLPNFTSITSEVEANPFTQPITEFKHRNDIKYTSQQTERNLENQSSDLALFSDSDFNTDEKHPTSTELARGVADTTSLYSNISALSKPYLRGGEQAAIDRLDHYINEVDGLKNYKWTRNRSLGLDYSSKFSAYLAYGCLSPRLIYHRVKQYEIETKKTYGSWWFIFELVWRDFFIFRHMRVGKALFSKNGFKGKKLVFEDSKLLFERWCLGLTGIPFVDAHMRQLNQTGYMSNRGRVNCASFLIHDYKVDWRWGASYFESRLIDYDVSVNWMNWHMQAFEIWYTNPIHQSNKYKAQDYIRTWIPELSALDDVTILIPWENREVDYPKPAELLTKWTRSINLIKKPKSKKGSKQSKTKAKKAVEPQLKLKTESKKCLN